MFPNEDYMKTAFNGVSKRLYDMKKNIAQPDYQQNDPTAPDYIKNRVGGYDISKTIEMNAEWKDQTANDIITSPNIPIAGGEVTFYMCLVTEDVTGLKNAIKNDTVVLKGNGHYEKIVAGKTWNAFDNGYVIGKDYKKGDMILPGAIAILKENTTYGGITYPKCGVYISGAQSKGNSRVGSKGFSSISWTYTDTDPVEIPLKYQEKETFLCTFTGLKDGSIECDKAFDELIAAYYAGKNIIGVFYDSDVPPVYATPIADITGGSIIFTFRMFAMGVNLQLLKIAVTSDGCKIGGALSSGSANNVMEPVYCNFTFNESTKAFECDIDYNTIREVVGNGLPVIGSVLGTMVYFIPGISSFMSIGPSSAGDSISAMLLKYNRTSKTWDASEEISLGGSSNSGLFIITETSGGGQGYSNSSASYTEMLAALDAGRTPVLVLNNAYYWLDRVDRENNRAYFCAVTQPNDDIYGIRLDRRVFWESKIQDAFYQTYDAYSPIIKTGYRQNGYIADSKSSMKDTPVYLYIDEDKPDNSDSPIYPLTKITSSSQRERQYGGIQYIESAKGHKFVYRQFTYNRGNSGGMAMKEWQIPEPSVKTDDQTQEVGIDTATGKLYTKPADPSFGITGAQVGQIAKITAVDENGKPTAWEPADLPGGGGNEWVKVAETTSTEIVNEIRLNFDPCKAVYFEFQYGAVENDLGVIGIYPNTKTPVYTAEKRTCAAYTTTSATNKRGYIFCTIDRRKGTQWVATSQIFYRSEVTFGSIKPGESMNCDIGIFNNNTWASFLWKSQLVGTDYINSVSAFGAGMNIGTTLTVWGIKV